MNASKGNKTTLIIKSFYSKKNAYSAINQELMNLRITTSLLLKPDKIAH